MMMIRCKLDGAARGSCARVVGGQTIAEREALPRPKRGLVRRFDRQKLLDKPITERCRFFPVQAMRKRPDRRLTRSLLLRLRDKLRGSPALDDVFLQRTDET